MVPVRGPCALTQCVCEGKMCQDVARALLWSFDLPGDWVYIRIIKTFALRKLSEARIALLRFIFEDVEQSALQAVFLNLSCLGRRPEGLEVSSAASC